ncbi:MAG: sigma-70 family RNA polymerase sigma factor [Bryobacterales bacterium]|nr:sigma-70 family RNA polymerase sigma factor [Bryobacterales bacterium]
MTPEAFGIAYEKGFAATIGFLLYRGARREEAEELAQAAWARGWEARTQLKEESRVLPWVNSIAYRNLCNARRRGGRFAELVEACAAAVSGAERARARVDCEKLLSKCEGLDRKLMVERYLEEREMGEMAERSGMTEVAVRVRLHRCRVGLKALVDAVGGRDIMPAAA